MLALLNKLGTEVAQKIASGELAVEIKDGKLAVQPAVCPLFDRHGRRIPKGLQNEVLNANHEYRLKELAEFKYIERLGRINQFFKQNLAVPTGEFITKVTTLITKIKSDPGLKNIFHGVYLPICIPQIKVDDYGRVLEEMFLPAVKRAYEAEFKRREFHSHLLAGSLAEQVSVVEESRHQRLVDAMSQGPVIGIYFPTVLQGFSISASREQMSSLPEDFILSGALDIATAIVMYPDVLCRGNNTPALNCATNSWRGPGRSFFFVASGDELEFDGGFLCAGGYDSGGLLFIG